MLYGPNNSFVINDGIPAQLPTLYGAQYPTSYTPRFTNSGAGFGAATGNSSAYQQAADAMKSRRAAYNGRVKGGTSNDAGAAGSTGAGFSWFSPELKSKFSGFTSKLSNPNINWTKGGGVEAFGHGLGGWFNMANAAKLGLDYANNYDTLQDSKSAADEMSSDIVAAALANPAMTYDLSPDQQRLLRQLQRGNEEEVGLSDIDIKDALGGGLKNGITGFLAGGIPGALIGAAGGLLNSGTESMNAAQQRKNAELEALYQSVMMSRQKYNNILQDRAYAYI